MIKKIYISWRQKPSERRILVAQLRRSDGGRLSFKYLEDYQNAKEKGLTTIFGFGRTPESLTSEDLAKIIRLRLVSRDKEDRAEFLEFWEAEKVDDDFMLLALTQGKSPSDNFEFLADFSSTDPKKINFITDISSLSYMKLSPDTIEAGDSLSYRKEVNNVDDKNAIAIYKNDLKIGYIKKIHNLIFSKHSDLQLSVKTTYANGILKQIFLKITKQQKAF